MTQSPFTALESILALYQSLEPVDGDAIYEAFGEAAILARDVLHASRAVLLGLAEFSLAKGGQVYVCPRDVASIHSIDLGACIQTFRGSAFFVAATAAEVAAKLAETRAAESGFCDCASEKIVSKCVDVTSRMDDFHACITGSSGFWGCGRTPNEALGSLVNIHAERFGLTLRKDLGCAPGSSDVILDNPAIPAHRLAIYKENNPS